jgi:hypothetical protein
MLFSSYEFGLSNMLLGMYDFLFISLVIIFIVYNIEESKASKF